MKLFVAFLTSVLCSTGVWAGDLKFRMQEIDTTLKIGYGVVIADVNGDGKPDIVVCDARRVVWYENPTWKRRIIIEDQTPPDNVCIAPCDIDRDGKIDFFLGADWGRMDTTKGGTIHWLRRGKSLDEKWEVYKIGEEPTVHRMRVCNWGTRGEQKLIVAPLMGRDATRNNNWLDGRPVRIVGYSIPIDPVKGPWIPPYVLYESLHVVHNFEITTHWDSWRLLTASYEGVTGVRRDDSGLWETLVHEGNQKSPDGSRGASEVKLGHLLAEPRVFISSVEPWHGHEIVVYRDLHGSDGKEKAKRIVIDGKLRWGHALWCADLDGDGSDEIIAGIRDDLSKNPGERRGVRVYKCTDGKGEKWDRQIVDDGGIACEDLVVHDLDGDGRPDIIATGRHTGNVRIYWNVK